MEGQQGRPLSEISPLFLPCLSFGGRTTPDVLASEQSMAELDHVSYWIAQPQQPGELQQRQCSYLCQAKIPPESQNTLFGLLQFVGQGAKAKTDLPLL